MSPVNSLTIIWKELQTEYFPERSDLLRYTVTWSQRRQRRTLASCNVTKKRVLVALELNAEHLLEWLPPLLYHEMCHAVLGTDVSQSRGRRLWHGPQFKALEARHPKMAIFDKWVKDGGWTKAIRSHRAKAYWSKKRRSPVVHSLQAQRSLPSQAPLHTRLFQLLLPLLK